MRSFAWSPDGSRLVYSAEAAEQVFQTFVTEVDRTSLLGPHTSFALGSGSVFQVSPDGSRAAFRALPSCEVQPFCTPSAVLYGALLDGSQAAAVWDSSLPGYSSPFVFDPAGSTVVFQQIARAYRNYSSGLFSFAAESGGAPISLTEPSGFLPEGISVQSFRVGPDGARVVYLMQIYDESPSSSRRMDRRSSISPTSA